MEITQHWYNYKYKLYLLYLFAQISNSQNIYQKKLLFEYFCNYILNKKIEIMKIKVETIFLAQSYKHHQRYFWCGSNNINY